MNRLMKLLDGKGPVLSAWASWHDPFYLSGLAHTKFDAVTLDMQHGMQTEDSVIRGIAAIAPTGKPVIVRIPVGRFNFASKALDAGAHAIIAPMINSVEDAKELVSFTKYPPIGDRSYGPTQAVHVIQPGTAADYVTVADRETKVFAMIASSARFVSMDEIPSSARISSIETKRALDAMDEILALDGIDGIFCGPSDLSISLSGNVVPKPFGEETVPTIEKMAKAAHEAGKLAAVFCAAPHMADTAHGFGYDFIALGFDSGYLNDGCNTMIDKTSFR